MDTKAVFAGNVQIGGGAPVTVQSMTNTDTRDASATIAQIRALADAGAEIVRVSVYDETCARNVRVLVDESPVPLVADIHFDHRLASKPWKTASPRCASIPATSAGKRTCARWRTVCAPTACRLRIGVNAGSLERDILQRYGGVTAEGMVESGLNHARMLERAGWDEIVLSFKASSVRLTVDACRLAARRTNYPQHIALPKPEPMRAPSSKAPWASARSFWTASATPSASPSPATPCARSRPVWTYCAPPGLRKDYVEVVSCPTCGRTAIEVEALARRVREATKHIRRPLRVAVMGCVVNGPGEAKEADVGVAGGKDGGALFVKGQPPRAVHGDLAEILLAEIQRILQ